MSQKRTQISETIIKIYIPASLKRQLQARAEARGLTLSALMRLIATEYIKLKK